MIKKVIGMMFCLMALMLIAPCKPVEAASVKLNKKKVTLTVGQKKQLKVKGTKKKARWRSKNSSVAKVNSKGVILAKKTGKTIIIARVNNKNLKCKVTVKEPAIQSNFDKLKRYIIAQNQKNIDNNYFISNNFDNTVYTYGIVYDASKQVFQFTYIKNLESLINITMDVKGTDIKVSNLQYGEFTWEAEEYKEALKTASGNINHNNHLKWQHVSGGKDVSSEANKHLNIAYSNWNKLLSKTGLTMEKLGFGK